MPGKFVIKKGPTGKFRFTLVSTNGEIVATSRAYESKASAKRGVAAVQRLVSKAAVVDETAPRNKATPAKKTAKRVAKKTAARSVKQPAAQARVREPFPVVADVKLPLDRPAAPRPRLPHDPGWVDLGTPPFEPSGQETGLPIP